MSGETSRTWDGHRIAVPDVLRFEVARAKLQAIVRRCPVCLGIGHAREVWECFGMTDDPRVTTIGAGGAKRRAALESPQVNPHPLGAAVLRSPCPGCRELRQVIELLGGAS